MPVTAGAPIATGALNRSHGTRGDDGVRRLIRAVAVLGLRGETHMDSSVTASSQSDGRGRPETAAFGASRYGMWLPLVVVMLALLVLAGIPILVSYRVRVLRQAVSDVTDPARVLTNDIEASLAIEMFTVGTHASYSELEEDQRYLAALRKERGDATALDSLVPFLTPEVVERFASYREASSLWHDAVARSARAEKMARAQLDTAGTYGISALAAASRLDALLGDISRDQRGRVLAVERTDVRLPAALVPVALLACIIVFRAGQRTLALAEEAEKGRKAVSRVMEEKSALLRGVTHDLKNPLGAALGYSELLADGAFSPPEQGEILLRIRRLLKVTLDTVSSLLDISRHDTGAIDLDRGPVDVAALARAAVEDFGANARAKSIELSLAALDELPLMAFADAARARHIVHNLVSNAIKYTPRGGRVQISAARRTRDGKSWATFSVRDSGPGVPPEFRERVFEEFFRIPDLRGAASGHGIGLAVSRRTARLMNGDVTIEDAEPGSTFTLWLPQREADTDGVSPRTRVAELAPPA